MPKPKPIQISIPHPCTQSWDEMTPDGQGRHCAHCQKTVIDFTEWSDVALYKYFATNTGHTCGRFLSTQLNRSIKIPYQPHSRLYRMTLALGLTLLFTQTTHLHAQTKPSITIQRSNIATDNDDENEAGLAGTVQYQKDGSLLQGVLISIFHGTALVDTVFTDSNGHYVSRRLPAGYYSVKASQSGYDTIIVTRVVVSGNNNTTVNVSLFKINESGSKPIQKTYVNGFIDRDPYGTKTFYSEQLNHMPR